MEKIVTTKDLVMEMSTSVEILMLDESFGLF